MSKIDYRAAKDLQQGDRMLLDRVPDRAQVVEWVGTGNSNSGNERVVVVWRVEDTNVLHATPVALDHELPMMPREPAAEQRDAV